MKKIKFPEGQKYLALLRDLENLCEKKSLNVLPAGDKNLEKIIERMGTVLSLLYRFSCCHWGCHGKEHVFESLAGRTVTSAQSALRVLGFGYYDESLALTRNIAEIGNLVWLFYLKSSYIRSWLDLPDQQRRQQYSPFKVRKKIEDLGNVVPMDQEGYSWLCEAGVHVTPKTRPQMHNEEGRPILGSIYQPKGFSIAVENLAWGICTVAGPIAKTAILKRKYAERLVEETIDLAEMTTHPKYGHL